MIIIGSAILFAIGLLILSVQAIRIAFGLLKLTYYFVKLAVCLVVLVLCTLGLFCQWCLRWLKGHPEPIEPKPPITVNFYLADEDDGPTIDLPRENFRRLRD
jgi:hypothetical protein